jgi:hypothetical protein
VAGVWADLVLMVHALYVGFVVVGWMLIVAGGGKAVVRGSKPLVSVAPWARHWLRRCRSLVGGRLPAYGVGESAAPGRGEKSLIPNPSSSTGFPGSFSTIFLLSCSLPLIPYSGAWCFSPGYGYLPVSGQGRKFFESTFKEEKASSPLIFGGRGFQAFSPSMRANPSSRAARFFSPLLWGRYRGPPAAWLPSKPSR